MNPPQVNQPKQLPAGAKMVAWLLVVGGALFAVVGTIGLFNQVRAEALMGMLMLAFGVVYFVVGRGMLRGSRPAYLVAVGVLGASVALAVVRAVIEGDRSLISQGFVPAVALWVLLSAEPRAYFARSASGRPTPDTPSAPGA
ncbi:MAG TPA: hypothetical protein VFR23_10155 [Jiangellaceae bacterium]|nr:hypothetical protein [Jiangellaceae bacterium]